MAHPITFLWTVPRSVSTSFERMMIERGDHIVFHEPYSRSYYLGPEQRSDRYAVAGAHHSVDAVTAELQEAARSAPVFAKDMAYHAIELVDPEVLAGFRHSFLIRHPAATLRSLASRWPDFTDAEAGWAALGRLVDLVQTGAELPVVIEAERVCADPPGVVAAWCDAMGLPFVADALDWEPGMRPEWELWESWHASSAVATGFEPLAEAKPLTAGDAPRVHEAHGSALVVYERLKSHAITSSGR